MTAMFEMPLRITAQAMKSASGCATGAITLCWVPWKSRRSSLPSSAKSPSTSPERSE